MAILLFKTQVAVYSKCVISAYARSGWLFPSAKCEATNRAVQGFNLSLIVYLFVTLQWNVCFVITVGLRKSSGNAHSFYTPAITEAVSVNSSQVQKLQFSL